MCRLQSCLPSVKQVLEPFEFIKILVTSTGFPKKKIKITVPVSL